MQNLNWECYKMNIKNDFPIFNNHKITYFDNASTTQKPQCVINTVVEYYSKFNANVHRGAYSLAEESRRCSCRRVADNLLRRSNSEIWPSQEDDPAPSRAR